MPVLETIIGVLTAAEAFAQLQKERTVRYLKVVNNTGNLIQVEIRYFTFTPDRGWEWLPAGPESSEGGYIFQMKAGETTDVKHYGHNVVASKIRIRVAVFNAGDRLGRYWKEDYLLVPSVYHALVTETSTVAVPESLS